MSNNEHTIYRKQTKENQAFDINLALGFFVFGDYLGSAEKLEALISF